MPCTTEGARCRHRVRLRHSSHSKQANRRIVRVENAPATDGTNTLLAPSVPPACKEPCDSGAGRGVGRKVGTTGRNVDGRDDDDDGDADGAAGVGK